MGLFSKKVVVCPLCDYQFPKSGVELTHFLQHVTDAGGGEYMYTCEICDEKDGMCNNDTGAMAGLTMHLQQRHSFSVF
jgi:hypothetical protein